MRNNEEYRDSRDLQTNLLQLKEGEHRILDQFPLKVSDLTEFLSSEAARKAEYSLQIAIEGDEPDSLDVLIYKGQAHQTQRIIQRHSELIQRYTQAVLFHTHPETTAETDELLPTILPSGSFTTMDGDLGAFTRNYRDYSFGAPHNIFSRSGATFRIGDSVDKDSERTRQIKQVLGERYKRGLNLHYDKLGNIKSKQRVLEERIHGAKIPRTFKNTLLKLVSSQSDKMRQTVLQTMEPYKGEQEDLENSVNESLWKVLYCPGYEGPSAFSHSNAEFMNDGNETFKTETKFPFSPDQAFLFSQNIFLGENYANIFMFIPWELLQKHESDFGGMQNLCFGDGLAKLGALLQLEGREFAQHSIHFKDNLFQTN